MVWQRVGGVTGWDGAAATFSMGLSIILWAIHFSLAYILAKV